MSQAVELARSDGMRVGGDIPPGGKVLHWRDCVAAIISALLALLSAPLEAMRPAFPEGVAGAYAQARKVAKDAGSALWPGFGTAHFGFMLIEQNREWLVCDDRMPPGFVYHSHDPFIDCDLSIGPTSWRTPDLLAAMPVFGPPSLIVMGTPVTTGRSLARWQITVLHEHFHQWQSAQPGYYDRIATLNLARGDETGMWMLNYPFPYSADAPADAHANAAIALAHALDAPNETVRAMAARYLLARELFEASVSADDWRYFEFQLWQEGVARWTEMTIAKRSDSEALVNEALQIEMEVMSALRRPDLARDGRLSAYGMGAGEAMLLERIWPDWRSCYAKSMALGVLLRRGCTSR